MSCTACATCRPRCAASSTCRRGPIGTRHRTSCACPTAIREYRIVLPTDDPFFSIVLATYNRGAFIAPTIESVLGQTFGSFELIVVGDACDDNTGDVVRGFGSERVTWRNLAVNCGSQSAPNNEGLRHARGEWIAYIGHDDIWAPDHL